MSSGNFPEFFQKFESGGIRIFITMKSSYSSYSKSRKNGKKFNLRIQQNNQVLKEVKESN